MRANLAMRIGLEVRVVKELAFGSSNPDELVSDLLKQGGKIFEAECVFSLLLGGAQTPSAESIFVISRALLWVP